MNTITQAQGGKMMDNMKKRGHTKGPWKMDREMLETADGISLGEIYMRNTYHLPAPGQRLPAEGDGEANAALIAAAPELLEALKQIQRACRADDLGLLAFNMMTEAITRAEGRA